MDQEPGILLGYSGRNSLTIRASAVHQWRFSVADRDVPRVLTALAMLILAHRESPCAHCMRMA